MGWVFDDNIIGQFLSFFFHKTWTIRVATRQGKVREIEIFSRSGNCQGIL